MLVTCFHVFVVVVGNVAFDVHDIIVDSLDYFYSTNVFLFFRCCGCLCSCCR